MALRQVRLQWANFPRVPKIPATPRDPFLFLAQIFAILGVATLGKGTGEQIVFL